MTLFKRISWPAAFLLLCAFWANAAHSEDDTVTLNFVNADIESVTKAVGLITNRNFIIDPRVKGTVNIVSARPVARSMTYSILLSALRLQGFAAVESEGMTKIVPEADAKQHFSNTGDSKKIKASGDQIITQVYPLQNESAAQLVPILRPLITPNNSISAYANTNTLVITDYADNIRRINKIIESIDQPNTGDVTLIKLQHVSALDLSGTLNRLLGDGGSNATPSPASADVGQKFIVLPDVRSNSLLIRSDNAGKIARARSLVQQLDIPGNTVGNINVVYLRNAEASKLAETLRAIVSGESRLAVSGAERSNLSGNPSSNAQAPTFGSSSNTSGAPAASTTSTGSMIQADPQTNSLIITAPDHVYNTLRGIIDKLDARRAQIYVEALIAEVSTDKSGEFGIQWMAPLGSSKDNKALVAGTSFSTGGSNIINLNAKTNLPSNGFNLGFLQKLTIGGEEVIGLTALARALEADTNANILSTPNLLTLDNEEAKIVIGKNVPFVTGSYAQSGASTPGTTVTPFQTVERKDVGLTLKVKPQVAEGGTVKLQIYQEASSIDSVSNTAGIITNKRSIESTVLVDDGQIIVLGGLMQDDVQDGSEMVPGLGQIPILGSLFRYDTRKNVKTNLMVFIRPKILRNSAAANSLTEDRYDYIRNRQESMVIKPNFFLPEATSPTMPSLKMDMWALDNQP
jgi:general secretion pathway protein D